MLLKHGLQYLIVKSGAGVMGLLSVLVFTRLLSPDEYGIYAMVLSGVSICSAVLFQWLSLGLGRLYAMDGINADRLLSTLACGFFLTAGIALGFWAAVYYFFEDPIWMPWLVFLPPLVISYSWFEINLRMANASLKPGLYGGMTFAKAGLGLFIGLLLYRSWGLGGVFGGLILSAIITPLFWMRNTWRRLRVDLFDAVLFRRFLSYGMPLAVTVSLTLVVDVSDRFIIAAFLGEKQAGLYSASYDLVVQTMGFVVAAFYLAAFPVLIQDAEAGNIDKIRVGLRQYGTLLLATCLPMLIIFVALSDNIAREIFGQPFRESATQLIPIIAFGILVGSFKIHFIDLMFQLKQKTADQIWPALLTALSNIILNIQWIPVYGLKGAAYATLTAFSMGLIASLVMANRILKLPHPGYDILKVLLAGACMYSLLLFLECYVGLGALLLQISAGLFIYFALLVALDTAEIRHLFLSFFFRRV